MPPFDPPTAMSRDRKLEIRLSSEEHETLKERFGAEKLSTIVRTYLLTCQLPRRSRKPDPKTLRALAYIGNNLNQIARSLNASQGRALDKIQLLRELAELRHKIGGLK